jgi:S-adenosylhomocysteine hydrolase
VLLACECHILLVSLDHYLRLRQQVAALQDAAQHTEAGAASTRYTLGSGSSVTLISDGKLLEFATNTSTNSTNGGTAEQSTSLFAVSAALATQLLALVEMHRER